MEGINTVVSRIFIAIIAALIVTADHSAMAAGIDKSAVSVTGKASAGTAFADPSTGMVFMPVPGGCFLMGDTYGDGQGDEKPVHEVCLDGFSIGKYEVTNAQYRMFKPEHSSGAYEANTLDDDNQPVGNVSWNDAVAYSKWLSKRSGRTYRLPTEAEWEYAARGGTGGRNFWDNDPDGPCRSANGADLTAKSQWPAWTTTNCNDGYKVAAPVGSFKPNAFGVHDMMGNAWEWTGDWYDAEYYFNSPKSNPRGPAGGKLRIPRGGGWGNASECVRVSDRNGFDPEFRILFLGFRLVSPVQNQ